MILFRSKLCKFFSLIEIWGWFTNFSITNFSYIYDYMLKKGLTISIFNISNLSIVLCLFLLHLMKIFQKTHNFCNKTIVKHCLTLDKYCENMINTKFSTVNHYLTNCKIKNLLSKEGIIK